MRTMEEPAPRALVVDDEEALLDVMRTALGSRGWEVACATTAGDGLAQFRLDPPDVVLTDKNLPGMSGVDLVRELRRVDQAVGIVMITGWGSAESARETLNLGIDDYIEKPFEDIFQVVDVMGDVCRRARARRAAQPLVAGPLTVVLAASGERRELIERHLDASRDKVVFVTSPDEIKPQAKSEHADVVVIDGASFPEEITCLAAGIKARASFAACIVLSQGLGLTEVKRLIQLEVRALIDHPSSDSRFADELKGAVERVRRSRAPRSPT
jgi:DNA-binding response OmpR family regulator